MKKKEHRKGGLKIIKYGINLHSIFTTLKFELRSQMKKCVILIGVTIVFTLVFSIVYPYHFRVESFYKDYLQLFPFYILFVTCIFFSNIITMEFNKKTGYIMFTKINKLELTFGKFLARITLIQPLILLYFLILIIFSFNIYSIVIPELVFSFTLSILYMITLSGVITFFSSFMPSGNMVTIVGILLFLILFPIGENILTAINQDLEPVFSLFYIAKIIPYSIPGTLPMSQRWNWVYFAGDELPPVRIWLTPTIGMCIIIMIIYLITSILGTYFILKKKQLK